LQQDQELSSSQQLVLAISPSTALHQISSTSQHRLQVPSLSMLMVTLKPLAVQSRIEHDSQEQSQKESESGLLLPIDLVQLQQSQGDRDEL
jgi:hypothetical protein